MTAHVLFNRMSPYGVGGFIPPPSPPAKVGVSNLNTSIVEGQPLNFTIDRTVNLTSECSVGWNITSAASADLVAPTSGTVTFLSGQSSKSLTVESAHRTGLQGDRTATMTLVSPIGCELDTTKSSAVIVIHDEVEIPPTAVRPQFAYGGQFIGLPNAHMCVGNFHVDATIVAQRLVSRVAKPIIRVRWDVRVTQTDHLKDLYPGAKDQQPGRYSYGNGGVIYIEVRRAKPGTEASAKDCVPDMRPEGLIGRSDDMGNPPWLDPMQPVAAGKPYGTGYGRVTADRGQMKAYDNFTQSHRDGGNNELWRLQSPSGIVPVGEPFFILWCNKSTAKADNYVSVNTHYNIPYWSTPNVGGVNGYDRRGPYSGWVDQIILSNDGGTTWKYPTDFGTTCAGFSLQFQESGTDTTEVVDESISSYGLNSGGSGNWNGNQDTFTKTTWFRWEITDLPFSMDANQFGTLLWDVNANLAAITVYEANTAGGTYNQIYEDLALDLSKFHQKDSVNTYGGTDNKIGKDGPAVPWGYWPVVGVSKISFQAGKSYRWVLRVQEGNSVTMTTCNPPDGGTNHGPRDWFPSLVCSRNTSSGSGSWNSIGSAASGKFYPGCWIQSGYTWNFK
jgi:hypothetical protein